MTYLARYPLDTHVWKPIEDRFEHTSWLAVRPNTIVLGLHNDGTLILFTPVSAPSARMVANEVPAFMYDPQTIIGSFIEKPLADFLLRRNLLLNESLPKFIKGPTNLNDPIVEEFKRPLLSETEHTWQPTLYTQSTNRLKRIGAKPAPQITEFKGKEHGQDS